MHTRGRTSVALCCTRCQPPPPPCLRPGVPPGWLWEPVFGDVVWVGGHVFAGNGPVLASPSTQPPPIGAISETSFSDAATQRAPQHLHMWHRVCLRGYCTTCRGSIWPTTH